MRATAAAPLAVAKPVLVFRVTETKGLLPSSLPRAGLWSLRASIADHNPIPKTNATSATSATSATTATSATNYASPVLLIRKTTATTVISVISVINVTNYAFLASFGSQVLHASISINRKQNENSSSTHVLTCWHHQTMITHLHALS